MSFPVTINGNTYNEADFAGYGYKTALPNITGDVAAVAAEVAADKTVAAAAALTAINAPGTSATSTTSLAIGTGSKTLIIQTAKSIVVGMSVKIASTASPTNWMHGDVTAYVSGTGSLTVNVTTINGSGTLAAWTVSLSGPAGAGSVGGETAVALSAGQSLTLTSASKQVQTVTASAIGTYITFPNATTLTEGPDKYVVVVPSNSHPVGLLDGNGKVMGQVIGGNMVRLHLADATTVGGVWHVEGELDPWWETAKEYIYAQYYQSVKLSDTASLIFHTNAAGYPCVRYLSHPSGGTLSVGSSYVLESVSGQVTLSYSIPVGATRYLVYLSGSSKYVLIDFTSGPTISVGTPVAVAAITSPLDKVVDLDGRYVVAFGYNAAGALWQAACYDCGASGTAVTAGTVATAAGTGTSGYQSYKTHLVSSTVVGFFGRSNQGSYYVFYLNSITRTSGTTLSWGTAAGVPTGMKTDDTGQIFVAESVTGATYLVPYFKNSYALAYSVLTFASSCTWGTSYDATGLTISATGTVTYSKCGASSWVFSGSQTSASKLQAISVSGTVVTVGTAVAADSVSNKSANTTTPGCSIIDGRGIALYYHADDSMAYATFSVSGTTITVGSKTVPNGASTYGPYSLGNAGYGYAQITGTSSVFRYIWAQKYNSSYSVDYNTLIQPFDINASGVMTLSADTDVLGDVSQPNGFALANDAKAIYSFGKRHWHGAIIGGVMKHGYGRFSASGVSTVINSSRDGLAYEGNSRIIGDTTLTLTRYRFAEV
jgi:hypothetical protein